MKGFTHLRMCVLDVSGFMMEIFLLTRNAEKQENGHCMKNSKNVWIFGTF